MESDRHPHAASGTPSNAERLLRILTRAIKTGTATTEIASQVSLSANVIYADLNLAFAEFQAQIKSRRTGGRLRGEQLRARAKEIASEIYNIYKEQQDEGVPKRKLMSTTARLVQLTGRHGNMDVRQVRRYVNRHLRKGSS